MLKWIVGQNRDAVYKNVGEELHSELIINDRMFYGINLLMGDDFLGTFDSPDEIVSEMNRIRSCEDEIYMVSGFSGYDGQEDFDSLIASVDALSEGEYYGTTN